MKCRLKINLARRVSEERDSSGVQVGVGMSWTVTAGESQKLPDEHGRKYAAELRHR